MMTCDLIHCVHTQPLSLLLSLDRPHHVQTIKDESLVGGQRKEVRDSVQDYTSHLLRHAHFVRKKRDRDLMGVSLTK